MPLFINADFDDTTITLRKGHTCMVSLRNYHDLSGDLGLSQFTEIFRGNTESYDSENLENDNVVKDLNSNSKHELDAFNEQEIDWGDNFIKNSNSKCGKREKSELLPKTAAPIVSAVNSVVNITIQLIHNH